MKRILVATLLMIVLLVKAHASEKIKANEAIRLAEQFIVEQGYTDQPANREKLIHESFDRPEGIEETLKRRANSLNPKATGVLPYNLRPKSGEGRAGWTVAFRWKFSSVLSPVRIVTMQIDGGNPIMQHTTEPIGKFLRH